jgi:chromosome segregation ATPase
MEIVSNVLVEAQRGPDPAWQLVPPRKLKPKGPTKLVRIIDANGGALNDTRRLEAQIVELQANNNGRNKQIHYLSGQIAGLREVNNVHVDSIQRLNAQVTNMMEASKCGDDSIQRLNEKLAELSKEKQVLYSETTELTETVRSLEKQNAELMIARDEVINGNVENVVIKLRERLANANADIKTKNSALERLSVYETENEDFRAQLLEKAVRLTKTEKSLEESEEKGIQLSKELTEKLSELDGLNDILMTLTFQHVETERAAQSTAAQYTVLQQQHSTTTSELDTALSQLVEQRSGRAKANEENRTLVEEKQQRLHAVQVATNEKIAAEGKFNELELLARISGKDHSSVFHELEVAKRLHSTSAEALKICENALAERTLERNKLDSVNHHRLEIETALEARLKITQANVQLLSTEAAQLKLSESVLASQLKQLTDSYDQIKELLTLERTDAARVLVELEQVIFEKNLLATKMLEKDSESVQYQMDRTRAAAALAEFTIERDDAVRRYQDLKDERSSLAKLLAECSKTRDDVNQEYSTAAGERDRTKIQLAQTTAALESTAEGLRQIKQQVELLSRAKSSLEDTNKVITDNLNMFTTATNCERSRCQQLESDSQRLKELLRIKTVELIQVSKNLDNSTHERVHLAGQLHKVTSQRNSFRKLYDEVINAKNAAAESYNDCWVQHDQVLERLTDCLAKKEELTRRYEVLSTEHIALKVLLAARTSERDASEIKALEVCSEKVQAENKLKDSERISGKQSETILEMQIELLKVTSELKSDRILLDVTTSQSTSKAQELVVTKESLSNYKKEAADKAIMLSRLEQEREVFLSECAEAEFETAKLKRHNAELVAELADVKRLTSETSVEMTTLKDNLRLCTVEKIDAVNASNNYKTEIDTLKDTTKTISQSLEVELRYRKEAERALRRALYTAGDAVFVEDRAHKCITVFHACCADIPDLSVEDAIFGNSAHPHSLLDCLLREGATVDDVRVVVSENRATLANDLIPLTFRITLDQALSIRLYTYNSARVRFFQPINRPFYSVDRSLESTEKQRPYVKTLIQALQAMGNARGFERGVVYRGAKLETSPYLTEVYHNFVANNADNRLIAGRLLRFPIFTSTSSSKEVAMTKFGSDVVYIITLNHDVGVDISKISCFEMENEVLLIPPVSLHISAVNLEDTPGRDRATLIIHLHTVDNNFAYI